MRKARQQRFDIEGRRSERWRLTGIGLFAVLGWSCTESVQVGYDRVQASGGNAGWAGTGGGFAGVPARGGAGGTDGTSGGGGGAGESACEVRDCGRKVYACGDCVDNDEDGLADALDPECFGACDNDEGLFGGSIPGQNNAPCKQDCFFDQDSGSGNDGCDWTHACDPLSVAPDYPPSGQSQCSVTTATPAQEQTCQGLRSAQPPRCVDTCLPLVPNGCDCFGCCELPGQSGSFVWLGSAVDRQETCDRSQLGSAVACRPCTPVSSCFNACEGCETCVGSTRPRAGCAGTDNHCPAGVEPCGPGARCPVDAYCITGCCVPVPR
ncbi:MAG TPA: hypothetical protein VER33_13400 [Polyangiaceae bacterium]|nr:hypothetical protein [Polyangiaceae bacterium]